eukprot:scpid51332/ scgid7007/ Cleavage stimulation factor subunit 3; CF-1 77 kDa subunit; Cleavage stimulation factor 77 kDa subunit
MYVRETKATLPGFREKMTQAYEFALTKVGQDIGSTQIWVDYIAFLRAGDASGSFAENQKIASIRRVYQRVCSSPILNIDPLWKEYNVFEQNVNKVLAKKLCDERARDFKNALRVAKEAEHLFRDVEKGTPSVPPGTLADEQQQLRLWKKIIAWEKTNPCRSDNPATVKRRVMFTYEQCLLVFGHHPDIWYEAAHFLSESARGLTDKSDTLGKEWLDEVTVFFERAIGLFMSRNQLVHFAYADFEQSRMHYDKCHEIYTRLIKSLGDTDHSLTYVQYMKFARQAEGMKAARLVFKKAREDQQCAHPAFVAAALMEYACSKDKTIAIKIFELGLKRFATELEYVKAYLQFMISLNEDNNTRVLFERLVGGLAEDKSRELWDIFRRFESSVGDLSSLLKVEKRMTEVFSKSIENCEAPLIVDRYRFLGLWPCSDDELLSMNHKEFAKQYSILRSGTPTLLAARQSATKGDATQAKPVSTTDSSGRGMPDVKNMLPFRPSVRVGVNVQGVPGGSFPLPQPLTELSLAIPPPTSFQGPFVVVDDWLKLISKIDIPDDYETFAAKWEDRVKLDGDLAMKSASHFAFAKSSSRKRHGGEAHESDEEDAAPPVNDIYRVRQQKRVHTAISMT